MNKKFSVMLAVIFCALLAQAQDAPPASHWESDPLDVLEPQKQEAVEPPAPEFQEIPPEAPAASTPPAAESAPTHAEEVHSSPATTAEVPSSGSSSEPDYSREAEFHRIYKTYNEQPTSAEAWEKAAGSRQSETYQVQKGDTLSDISTTFFGDFSFWPKIWSLNNGQILNPHEILPGMNVQFFPGSLSEAPTLGVVAKAEEDQMVEGASVPAPEAAPVAEVQIPPAKKRSPVLKNIPASLPSYRVGFKSSTQVDIELKRTSFPPALEHLNYYINDTPEQGVGVVTGAEMDMKTAGEFQYIYVRLDDSSSKEFVAQKNLSEVKDPQVKDRRGYMVEIQGEIEVLERVNEQKNIYRAIVKKAILPVEVGAILVPGKIPMVDPSVAPASSGGSAKIMGGQFDKKRMLFGSNSLVFLDAGANQGLQVGQSMAIFADERMRNKKTDAMINDRVIGTVKIVKVSGNFATGYVTKATDDILLGDYIGAKSTHAFNDTVPAAEQKGGGDLEKEFEDLPADSSPPPTTPDSGEGDLELEL